MKMTKSRRYWVLAIAAGVMLLVSACSMGAKVPDPKPPGGDPPGNGETYVYFEDFTGYELGTQPDEWEIRNSDGDWGTVEIVEDLGADSNRALRMVSSLVPAPNPPDRNHENFSINTPGWSELIDEDVTAIGFEFKFRVVQSSGINMYITGPGNHKVVMGLGGGRIQYTDGSWQDLVNPLPDEWHTVRVIADRISQTADVYVNDAHVGVALGFRYDADAWNDQYVQFLVTTSPSVTKEVLFADLKMWVVD